jgi:hypothetical protein
MNNQIVKTKRNQLYIDSGEIDVSAVEKFFMTEKTVTNENYQIAKAKILEMAERGLFRPLRKIKTKEISNG